MLKLKKKFTAVGLLFFLKYEDIEKLFCLEKTTGWKIIGYLYNDNKVTPLHIMLPKTSAYIKSYDEQTKQMHFLIEDDELLEKYNFISDEVIADIKKNLIVSLSTIKNFWKP